MRPDQLYATDFPDWAREQAAALELLASTKPNVPIDWPNLIEEVAELGKSERDAVRSHLRTIMEHLLKLGWSTARDPRAGWRATVARARDDLLDKLSPSLRHDARSQLPSLFDRARGLASLSLVDHGEAEAAEGLPTVCPWTLEQVIDRDFWP